MVAFIARSAIKTLDFLIHLLCLDRRHNHNSTVSAFAAIADNNSSDPFLSRFLNFFKPNPNPNPSTSNLQQKPCSLVQCDDLLISFKRSTHPDETLHLFQELKRFDLFGPNLCIYITVMDALVSLNQFREVEALFEEMIGSGSLERDIASVAYTEDLPAQTQDYERYFYLEDDVDKHWVYVRETMHLKFNQYRERLRRKYMKGPPFEND